MAKVIPSKPNMNLYCPFCGAYIAPLNGKAETAEGNRPIEKYDILECERCEYQAFAIAFAIRPTNVLMR